MPGAHEASAHGVSSPISTAPERGQDVLARAHADAYAALMRANAGHLTRLGDYGDEEVVGSVVLIPVDPLRYGLGQ